MPITLTGTASIGISVARQLWRKMNTTRVTSSHRLDQRGHHLLDGGGDERRRVERDLPVDARREAARQLVMRFTTACLAASALAPGRR